MFSISSLIKSSRGSLDLITSDLTGLYHDCECLDEEGHSLSNLARFEVYYYTDPPLDTSTPEGLATFVNAIFEVYGLSTRFTAESDFNMMRLAMIGLLDYPPKRGLFERLKELCSSANLRRLDGSRACPPITWRIKLPLALIKICHLLPFVTDGTVLILNSSAYFEFCWIPMSHLRRRVLSSCPLTDDMSKCGIFLPPRMYFSRFVESAIISGDVNNFCRFRLGKFVLMKNGLYCLHGPSRIFKSYGPFDLKPMPSRHSSNHLFKKNLDVVDRAIGIAGFCSLACDFDLICGGNAHRAIRELVYRTQGMDIESIVLEMAPTYIGEINSRGYLNFEPERLNDQWGGSRAYALHAFMRLCEYVPHKYILRGLDFLGIGSKIEQVVPRDGEDFLTTEVLSALFLGICPSVITPPLFIDSAYSIDVIHDPDIPSFKRLTREQVTRRHALMSIVLAPDSYFGLDPFTLDWDVVGANAAVIFLSWYNFACSYLCLTKPVASVALLRDLLFFLRSEEQNRGCMLAFDERQVFQNVAVNRHGGDSTFHTDHPLRCVHVVTGRLCGSFFHPIQLRSGSIAQHPLVENQVSMCQSELCTPHDYFMSESLSAPRRMLWSQGPCYADRDRSDPSHFLGDDRSNVMLDVPSSWPITYFCVHDLCISFSDSVSTSGLRHGPWVFNRMIDLGTSYVSYRGLVHVQFRTREDLEITLRRFCVSKVFSAEDTFSTTSSETVVFPRTSFTVEIRLPHDDRTFAQCCFLPITAPENPARFVTAEGGPVSRSAFTCVSFRGYLEAHVPVQGES